MIMQKNRNKKNSRSKQRNGRYNNSSGGAAPLEPIYENEHDGSSSNDETYDLLRDYMSKTILNHIRSNTSTSASANNNAEGSDHSSSDGLEEESTQSQFQIITDNASSHPEFVATKRKPSKRGEDSNNNSNKTKQKHHPRSKQSSTSTSESPTSSEGRWGSGESPSSTKTITILDSSINTVSTASSLTFSLIDDADRSTGSFDETKDMTSREILQRATDLVAGNYDYNNDSNINSSSRTGGRRKARRSSLPSMPTRSTSEIYDSPPQPAPSKKSLRSPPSSIYDSLRLESRAVVLDKFGIPIRPPTSSSNGICSSSGSSGGNRRRRRERRSSMPSRTDQGSSDASTASESSAQVDKFGIPIVQTTKSNGTATGRRRRERRSSMPKSMPTTRSSDDDGITTPTLSDQLSVHLDKFGIQIPPARSSPSNPSSLSTSAHSTGRRRHGRRSSMPTRSVTFDLPKTSSKLASIEDCDPSLAQPESGSVPVDKFGIPIKPKAMSPNSNSNNNNNSNGRRRRRQRRSSMPSTPTTTSDYSSSPVGSHDKFGVPLSSCNKPNHHMASRRRRRPSMPTDVVPNHSPITTMSSSVPCGHNTCGNTTCTASAMRFFPEELQIPGSATNKNKNRLSSALANGAPIRPERVPSEDSFGSKNKTKPVVNLEKQHNASFEDAHDTHLEVTHVRPTDSKTNNSNMNDNNNETLDQVVERPKSRWGAGDRDAKKGASNSNSKTNPRSDVSVNSLQQNDGEWWW